jgi:hypothetical protein
MRNGKTKIDFIIRGSPIQLETGPTCGWRMGILYSGPTAFLDELTVHIGMLDGRLSPHPPHGHDHEELHFALADHLEFVKDGVDGKMEEAKALAWGAVCFADSRMAHTFRNVGDDPASYLHLRWKRKDPAGRGKPGLWFFDPGPAVILANPAPPGDHVIERVIYSGSTRYLSSITLKCVVLPPGGRVPLHRHDHEVVFAFIAGSVEFLGKGIDAPGFAFAGSQVPHGVNNPGPVPAAFYAVEFHRPL